MTTNLNTYTFTNQELVEFNFTETDLSLIYKRFTTVGNKRFYINDDNLLFVDLGSNDEYFLIMDLNMRFNKILWDSTSRISYNNVNDLNSTNSLKLDVTITNAANFTTVTLTDQSIHTVYQLLQYADPAPQTNNTYYIKIIKWKPLKLLYVDESARLEFNSNGIIEIKDDSNRYTDQFIILRNNKTSNSTSNFIIDGKVSDNSVTGSFFTGNDPSINLSSMTNHPINFVIHSSDITQNRILQLTKTEATMLALNFKVKTQGLSQFTNTLIKNANPNGEASLTLLSDNNTDDTQRNAEYVEAVIKTKKEFNQVQICAVNDSEIIIACNTGTSEQGNLLNRTIASFNINGCTMHRLLNYPSRPRLMLVQTAAFGVSSSFETIRWDEVRYNTQPLVVFDNGTFPYKCDFLRPGTYQVFFNFVFGDLNLSLIYVNLRTLKLTDPIGTVLEERLFTGFQQGINFSTVFVITENCRLDMTIRHTAGVTHNSDPANCHVTILEL